MRWWRLLFLPCLILSVFGCGTANKLLVGEAISITKTFTKPVERCRVAAKDYLMNNYALKEIKKINDQFNIRELPKLKYDCDESSFEKKFRQLNLKYNSLQQNYKDGISERAEYYNSAFSKSLKSFNSMQRFYPIYIAYFVDYFTEEQIATPMYDVSNLGEKKVGDGKDLSHIWGSVKISRKHDNGFELDFSCYGVSITNFGRITETIGKDRLIISFNKVGDNITINLTQVKGLQYSNIVNLNKVLEYLESHCIAENIVETTASFRSFYDDNVQSLLEIRSDFMANIDEVRKKYEDLLDKLKDKKTLLSNLENPAVYCSLISKNLGLFESNRDVKTKNIVLSEYKNKSYVVFSFLYLNIFNNVNIKLNDQYKIARYLFDSTVRKGIREFSEALRADGVDGIAFEIAATDRSFIDKKKDPNVSMYTFYLPEREILLYINDDITGKELAESSYILVDGERIHLR